MRVLRVHQPEPGRLAENSRHVGSHQIFSLVKASTDSWHPPSPLRPAWDPSVKEEIKSAPAQCSVNWPYWYIVMCSRSWILLEQFGQHKPIRGLGARPQLVG